MTPEEFNKELDISAACGDFLRSKYGAHRGHPEWRAMDDAFRAGVNWALSKLKPLNEWRPIETAPKREWQGLTDEEKDYIWHTVGNSDAHGDVDGWSGRDVMNAIEDKLKEKNT